MPCLPVYPRWRGEHSVVRVITLSKNGLSPLARGTRRLAPLYQLSVRFIPAGAGNTVVLWLVCQISAGLSPLARGTLCGLNGDVTTCRFIPAGAGNTKFVQMEEAEISVYPRWRGEHESHTLACRQFNGLSPLARGTLAGCTGASPDRRFIPAGAGNTGMRGAMKTQKAVYPRWRGEH